MVARARTRWGGLVGGRRRPTGYFRVAEQDGVFWLDDPDGGLFLSKGINTVDFEQDRIRHSDIIPYALACNRKYGDRDRWRTAVAQRLTRWGFNTLGAWSDELVAVAGASPLAITPTLDLGRSHVWLNVSGPPEEIRQDFPDIFDPTFERHVRARAQDICAARREDKHIIGWFIDNELCWGPDWRGPEELLALFLNLAMDSPGRVAALDWLRKRHADFEKFNSVWRTPADSWDRLYRSGRITAPFYRKPPYERAAADEDGANRDEPRRSLFFDDCERFCADIAARYFSLTSAAIKAADPNHLLLGCRFAYVPPPAVLGAAARHNDVISFNCYGLDPKPVMDIYAATGKPCLIGEFSFRAADSGLPNTEGAGPVVSTQTERAACFRRYVVSALRQPALIGYHWFEHADQPPEGRFDGENSNFGTVTVNDDVYDELTRAMTSVNADAEDCHISAAWVTA